MARRHSRERPSLPAGKRRCIQGLARRASALRPAAAAFDATDVHGITSSETAARLWSIAVTAAATRTPAGLRNPAADFGTVMKTIGLDALPRGAAALAVRAQAGLLEHNARNLADLIYTEARGEGEKAQIAVGATVLNRMRRNGTDRVDDVRGGYSYLTPAPADKPAPPPHRPRPRPRHPRRNPRPNNDATADRDRLPILPLPASCPQHKPPIRASSSLRP